MAKVWTVTVDRDGEPMRTLVYVTEDDAQFAFHLEVEQSWAKHMGEQAMPAHAPTAYEALCNETGFLDTIFVAEHDISDHPELRGAK